MGWKNEATSLQFQFQPKENIQQQCPIITISRNPDAPRPRPFFQLHRNIINAVANHDCLACIGLNLYVLVSPCVPNGQNAFYPGEKFNITINEFYPIQIAYEPGEVRGMAELTPVGSLERYLLPLNDDFSIREQGRFPSVVDIEVGLDDVSNVTGLKPFLSQKFYEILLRCRTTLS